MYIAGLLAVKDFISAVQDFISAFQVKNMKLVSHNVNNSSTLPMQICLILIT